jgi:hypothetical protein
MRLLVFFCLGSLTFSLFAQIPSIDGNYELTERIMADGTVRRPPEIVALYMMADGRFSLNLFVKNGDERSRPNRRSVATPSARKSTASGSPTRQETISISQESQTNRRR